ncbi:MAG TPA: NUDIX domain-containing protein [Candidatus Saccharimonadales bacterium]|nr:NUDIX domain-containing protein [Candidatus Saccharimonadales bacterium]
MGHIHSDSEYDYTASALIVHNSKVLLLLHHKMQLWLPPAGHVELNEHPIEALYREVEEETGLTQEHLTMITPYTDNLSIERNPAQNTVLPMPFDMDVHTVTDGGHRHIDFAYIFVSDTDKIVREEDKADELAWFTLDQIDKLSPMLRKIYSHAKYALEKAEELQG